MRMLLATCAALPGGEPGGENLISAFDALGLESEWVRWDDPSIDWSSGLTCVRATWDYTSRLQEFLAWARRVSRMLNSADAFEWNTDKSYLLELAASGVPIVPTIIATSTDQITTMVESSGRSVVMKPATGVGGIGLQVISPGAGMPSASGRWVVQPIIESVRTEGELSAFVIGGEVVSAVLKRPAGNELRVHEEYGGHTVITDVTPELAELAKAAVESASHLTNTTLHYARVDALRLKDGTLALGELEITEPGLYLDVLPQNAQAFARMARDVG